MSDSSREPDAHRANREAAKLFSAWAKRALNHQSLNPKNHETLNMLAPYRVLGTKENKFYISVLYRCHVAC